MATDHYDAPDLSRLRSPSHDVERLKHALADPHIGAFDVQRVVNRQAHEIKAAVEDLFSERRPDDVLLLYFSCHGLKDDAGRLHFAATNTHVKRLGSTAVEATFVAEQVRLSMSRKIILLLDCCYSGAFTRGMLSRGGDNVEIQERLGGSGRAIIYSSTALEYAFEVDPQLPGEVSRIGRAPAEQPSIFTSAIIEGLTTGDADHDADGVITVDDLYEYVHTKVLEATPKQTPGKFVDVRGELAIAYSSKRSQPVLPEEVISAAEHPLPRVRQVAVDTLKRLALLGGEAGQPAYERLLLLINDDSRSVAAHAREAAAQVAHRVHRQPSSSNSGTRATPTPPRDHSARSIPSPPPRPSTPPFQAAGSHVPSSQPGPSSQDNTRLGAEKPAFPGIRGPVISEQDAKFSQTKNALNEQSQEKSPAAFAAYLLPVFTCLILAFTKKRIIRFHAIQAALADASAIMSVIQNAEDEMAASGVSP